MNINFKHIGFIFTAFIIICIGNVIIVAQNKSNRNEFCKNYNWSWNDKQSVNESREIVMPAVNQLTVDGKNNGGISVIGENRSDILVRACLQAWAETDEAARQLMQGIRIEKGSNIFAESASGDKNWSVSYEVLVPIKTDLKLMAHNGGIVISSVEGDIEFETRNGGISLNNLAGDVKGKTQNGGVSVKFSGDRWKGNGLDVETRNGGISIKMDENYAANIETGTVNGGFSSDIDALKIDKKDDERWYSQNKKINKAINGGGANVRIMTTNGGVTIKKY